MTEALGVDVSDASQSSKLKVDLSLKEVFDKAFPPPPTKKVATKDEEAKANGLKDEGLFYSNDHSRYFSFSLCDLRVN